MFTLAALLSLAPAHATSHVTSPVPAHLSAMAPAPSLPVAPPPRLASRARVSPLVINGLMMITGYTPTLALASLAAPSTPETELGAGLAFIPLAGPWAWLAVDPDGLGKTDASSVVALDGVLQAAGTGMLVSGLFGVQRRSTSTLRPSVSLGDDSARMGVSGRF